MVYKCDRCGDDVGDNEDSAMEHIMNSHPDEATNEQAIFHFFERYIYEE